MARTVIDTKLTKREQRLRLRKRKEPYWMTLNEGEHLGYYRGSLVGKWVARFRAPGTKTSYQRRTLGEADDNADADGLVILDFKQAQVAARKWISGIYRNDGRKTGAYTVSNALDDYLNSFQGRDLLNTRRRIDAIIRPQLGDIHVDKLTAAKITSWLNELACSPARARTAKGATQNFKPYDDTPEGRRRRRSSANRIFTILKAALNVAYNNGRVAADDSWRRVKPFPKADAAKLRYLSDDEIRRLVNACAAGFRPLVQAALLTGARYSELTRLDVQDFDRTARTIILRETKSGEVRAIYLENEGFQLFDQATIGKKAADAIFCRPDGLRWGASHQARPLLKACEIAGLQRTGFHDLRRTFGARLALKGVPMAVIAEALGHADERVTRRHYAHLSTSYVADTVRIAAAGLGIVEETNIQRLERS